MSDPKLNVVITVDGRQYEATLNRVDRKNKDVGNSAKRSAASVNQLAGAFRFAGAAVAAYVSLEVVRETIGRADAMAALTARVQAATKETGDFVEVNRQLLDISNRNGVALEDTVSLFQSLARVGPELGVTNSEILRVSNSVQQLGILSGASNAALSAGLLQFSQGLAAGTLRAEEFNSILENIPEVAVRIAKGMGLTVGQLRQAVLDGRVLSRDVFDALLSQADQITQDFEAAPRRISQSWEAANNQLNRFLDGLNRATSTTGTLGFLIDKAGESLGNWADRLTETELETAERKRIEAMQTLEEKTAKLAKEEDKRRRQVIRRDIRKAAQDIETLDAEIKRLNLEILNRNPNAGIPAQTRTTPTTVAPGISPAAAAAEEMVRGQFTETEKLSNALLRANALWNANQVSTDAYTSEITRLTGQTTLAQQQHDAYIERLAEAERVTLANRTAHEALANEITRLNALWLEGLISTETYTNAIQNANQSVVETSRDAANRWSQTWIDAGNHTANGIGNAVASIIFDNQNLADGLRNVIRGVGREVVSTLAAIAIKEAALFALRQTGLISTTGTSVAAGVSTAAAWAPAAAAVSLATLGGNALPAQAGITSTFALSKGLSLAGIAHEGLDRVPREGTYLLDEGERVVRKRDNQLLTRALQDGTLSGGKSTTVVQNFTFRAAETTGMAALIQRAAPAIKALSVQAVQEAMNARGRRGPLG